MRYFHLFLIFIAVILNSCCLVTSQDCGCDPPDPYVDSKIIEWQLPKESETLQFENQYDEIILIEKQYNMEIECLGGDECCTNFEVHNSVWQTINSNNNESILLSLVSLRKSVSFYSDRYPSPVLIYDLQPSTGEELISENYMITKSDTTINGQNRKLLEISKKNNTNTNFNYLLFIESIGIVEFTDLDGVNWQRK